MEQPLLRNNDITYYDTKGLLRSVRLDLKWNMLPDPQEQYKEQVLEFWNRIVREKLASKEILND